MAYVDYEFYTALYGEELTTGQFDNLEWEARRILDNHTTGIDNVKKLRVAFPEDPDDAEIVKRCVCKLINIMRHIDTVEKSRSLVVFGNGAIASGIVSSVSSGTESMTFSTDGGTSIEAAIGDINARNLLFNQTVKKYLSGVSDANGVNLLYMGAYPYVR